ncbi:MAG: cobaltochelatase subunit CobN, partial [Pelistega sp.]|nr:cobaltochelatase subunit CobN [Pelistega sp.]
NSANTSLINGAGLTSAADFTSPLLPSHIESATIAPLLTQAEQYAANLRADHEISALLRSLEGRFIMPGVGGDSIRNPEIVSGRNIYAFDAAKIPSPSAWEAAPAAFDSLLKQYQDKHQGELPTKMAFSLWSSDAIRTLGGLEAQVVYALGLKPIWGRSGRLESFEIIPQAQLKRARIDAVIQVTGAYRDQFDGFMHKLSEAIEQLSQLDEPNNPLYANTQAIYQQLLNQGLTESQAQIYASSRIFGNEPGQYGTGIPHRVQNNAAWDKDTQLAAQFIETQGYIFSHRLWGEKAASQAPIFAMQLKDAQAAVLSRSSNMHGMLSTDHAFEFLGGLSAAIRSLSAQGPTLLVSDQRSGTASGLTAQAFIAQEIRTRYSNRHWIAHMQNEGYAGTLEVEKVLNNMWGWQVMDPSSLQAHQWQAMFDVYVQDSLQMEMDAWFEQHNPNSQAQLIERMVEAIRKDYWQADARTQQALKARWETLHSQYELTQNPITREFIQQQLGGYGLSAAAPALEADSALLGPAEQALVDSVKTSSTQANGQRESADDTDIDAKANVDTDADADQETKATPTAAKVEDVLNSSSDKPKEFVRGQVLEKVEPPPQERVSYSALFGLLLLALCLLLGAYWQARRNRINHQRYQQLMTRASIEMQD